jgi:hypothetical protein
MKSILKYLPLIAFLALAFPQVSNAQEVARNEKKTKHNSGVEHLIESKRFLFEARTVSPIGGPTRQLTSYYDLTIKGDSLVSFLPYFGRAYVAPMTVNDGGIRFTSTEFNYEINARKKGGWNIKITPKDVNNVQQMNLSVSPNGQASLNVTSNNRQPISFMGVIREVKS